MSDQVYLTGEEVAERYRTAASTVRYWRMAGKGPKGVLVGRKVLYPMAEVERYDAELAAEADAAATAVTSTNSTRPTCDRCETRFATFSMSNSADALDVCTRHLPWGIDALAQGGGVTVMRLDGAS